MVGISPWHWEELMKFNPSNRLKTHFIEPGFDPNPPRFSRGVAKNLCVYISSHDRGLDDLLKMWPDIKRAVPDAWLLVCYDAPRGRTQDHPSGVYYCGTLDKEDHEDLLDMADVWLYPCHGQERFCIAAIKAQHYGTVPCVIPHMALRDTVQFGIKTDREHFASEAIKLLQDEELKGTIRTNMRSGLKYCTWDQVAQRWEKLIGQQ